MQIKDLNERCLKRIQIDSEEMKQRNLTEYIVIRNYLQKESYYIQDLINITKSSGRDIIDLLKRLKFIRFDHKKLVVKKKRLNWLRWFIEDFINFLNYPISKECNRSIEKVNYFIKNQKHTRDFKIILTGIIESKNHLFLTQDELEDISSIIKNASWGMSMYYFKQLHSIYQKKYPEIQSIQVEVIEPEKEEKEDIEPSDVLDEIEEEVNIRELISQNENLSENLSESRAVCDFIAMQYEDLKTKMEDTKKEAYEKILAKIFKNFNSIENNNALDAFFIARFTLNKLKKSGWKPSNPELNSALYIFDLFSEFFKRQGLNPKYEIGELIEITLENVDNFNYKGTEIRKNMKVITKVLSPAWFLKNKRISKAKVIEIKNMED